MVFFHTLAPSIKLYANIKHPFPVKILQNQIGHKKHKQQANAHHSWHF